MAQIPPGAVCGGKREKGGEWCLTTRKKVLVYRRRQEKFVEYEKKAGKAKCGEKKKVLG